MVLKVPKKLKRCKAARERELLFCAPPSVSQETALLQGKVVSRGKQPSPLRHARQKYVLLCPCTAHGRFLKYHRLLLLWPRQVLRIQLLVRSRSFGQGRKKNGRSRVASRSFRCGCSPRRLPKLQHVFACASADGMQRDLTPAGFRTERPSVILK